MNRRAGFPLTGLLLAAWAAIGSVQAQQVDADAAMALAKKNDCFKCHAVDKNKKAPAYARIAARLRSKPDAIERVIEQVTTGPQVELQDGSHEDHRIIDTRDPNELRNLARWILSL